MKILNLLFVKGKLINNNKIIKRQLNETRGRVRRLRMNSNYCIILCFASLHCGCPSFF